MYTTGAVPDFPGMLVFKSCCWKCVCTSPGLGILGSRGCQIKAAQIPSRLTFMVASPFVEHGCVCWEGEGGRCDCCELTPNLDSLLQWQRCSMLIVVAVRFPCLL